MALSKKAVEKNESDNQHPDILDTPKQKGFNDFLSQIKEKQKNIGINLFEEVFGYDTTDKMLQTLHSLERADSYNQEVFSIENMVIKLGDKIKRMPEGTEKNEGKKILKIVSKILDFNLNERKQRGLGFKISAPNQMLSRLSISAAQLKAGNNSEKLENEISQLLYSLYRSKNLQKISTKVWLTLFKHENNLYLWVYWQT